jgi:hypothetical protein
LSSEQQISVYQIPTRGDPSALATFETWTRADGSESALTLWLLRDGHLVRVARSDTARFQDLAVERSVSTLELQSSQFAAHVSACTMCTRLDYLRVLSDSAGRIRERAVSLNPWAAIVDELYGHLEQGELIAARRLLPRGTNVAQLRMTVPMFVADSGDPGAREGRADIGGSNASGCHVYWRFVSRGQGDGSWRVVAIHRGRWSGDSVVFDSTFRKLEQRKSRCR